MRRRSDPLSIARALLVALVLTLGPAAPALADEGWVIQRFAADITVRADGSLRIVEEIAVDFGTLERHGIFRDIPVRYQWDDTHVRVYKLSVVSVTDASERAVQYETSDPGGYRRIRIGDPNRTVRGAQTYRITYDVQGVLNGFSDRDELFWNVNGADWAVPTQSVSATVHAGAIAQVTCYQGTSGSREPCRATSSPERAEFVTARGLRSGEQLTIVVALPKGTVAQPAPIIERDTSDPAALFEPQPANLALTLFALLAGIAVLAWRWLDVGRDARVRETIVPEYEPPDKLRPAQLGLVLDESADTKDVTATIVDLAVRGYVTIEEVPSTGLFAKKDWTLRQTEKPASDLEPYESDVMIGLFVGRGGEVKVSELREHFNATLKSAEGKLYRDSVARGWFARRPDWIRMTYAGVGCLVMVVGAGLAWLLGQVFGAGLIGLAIVLVGILTLPLARFMPAKTAAGAELLRRTLGFRQYMEVAEKDRARFAERENIFSSYLPYAIVFGCVDRWARAFAGIDTAAQTAGWYVGTSPFDSMRLSSSLEGFSSNLGSAIAATAGSSGGSGFSGGGGAGGGGGGGGGGSW